MRLPIGGFVLFLVSTKEGVVVAQSARRFRGSNRMLITDTGIASSSLTDFGAHVKVKASGVEAGSFRCTEPFLRRVQ